MKIFPLYIYHLHQLNIYNIYAISQYSLIIYFYLADFSHPHNSRYDCKTIFLNEKKEQIQATGPDDAQGVCLFIYHYQEWWSFPVEDNRLPAIGTPMARRKMVHTRIFQHDRSFIFVGPSRRLDIGRRKRFMLPRHWRHAFISRYMFCYILDFTSHKGSRVGNEAFAWMSFSKVLSNIFIIIAHWYDSYSLNLNTSRGTFVIATMWVNQWWNLYKSFVVLAEQMNEIMYWIGRMKFTSHNVHLLLLIIDLVKNKFTEKAADSFHDMLYKTYCFE